MKTILKKPKRKKIRTWCSGGGTPVTIRHRKNVPKWLKLELRERGRRDIPRNSHVRCTVCDQRFEAHATPCCGGLCPPNYRVPRHKAY